jgi:hypothetical protein
MTGFGLFFDRFFEKMFSALKSSGEGLGGKKQTSGAINFFKVIHNLCENFNLDVVDHYTSLAFT